MSQKIDEFLGDIIKRMVFKNVPSLKGDEDIETMYQETECSSYKELKSQKLVYRVKGNQKWLDVFPNSTIDCKDCEDKKLGCTVEQIMKERKEILMKRYWSVPEDLVEAGFKNYKSTNDVTEKAKAICMKYVKHFLKNEPEKRVNLVLMGTPGTGKSHLSVAIARTIREKGFIVGYIPTVELLTKIKSTYNKDSAISEEQIMKDLKKFDLLVLDDLGAETHNLKDFTWTKTKLFEIINARIKMPTIYTTNLNDKALESAVGERVFSRLNANTMFIDLFTDDYRKNLRVVELEI